MKWSPPLTLVTLIQMIANTSTSASMEKFHEEMAANWGKCSMTLRKIVTGQDKSQIGEFFVRWLMIMSD
jgi:hypothetical protein